MAGAVGLRTPVIGRLAKDFRAYLDDTAFAEEARRASTAVRKITIVMTGVSVISAPGIPPNSWIRKITATPS